jgi:hypothetical protein
MKVWVWFPLPANVIDDGEIVTDPELAMVTGTLAVALLASFTVTEHDPAAVPVTVNVPADSVTVATLFVRHVLISVNDPL